MKRVDGSSPLDQEAQEFFAAKFGVRYHVIQDVPLRQSRRIRRAKKRGGVANVSAADVAAANLQHEIRKQLARDPLKSTVT